MRHVIENKAKFIDPERRFMLKDQMGLITLLSQELPDVSRRAEAIVNLAFNVSIDIICRIIF